MLYYFPLEPYVERYTFHLREWTERRFEQHNVPYVTIVPDCAKKSNLIDTGVVLDARRRSQWAMRQVDVFLREVKNVTSEDVIFIEDMFHPGFEALPYLFDQLNVQPRVMARNYAQSVDVDDFTYPMRRWMRQYEKMFVNVATDIFTASTVHAEMMHTACLDHARVHIVGQPYDMKMAKKVLGQAVTDFHDRSLKVIYTSRIDREKQPEFFYSVVRELGKRFDFVLCTGAKCLKSNEQRCVDEARELERDGLLTIHEQCSKKQYYNEVATARVQFNCARQDFISYTAIEASTFGTPTLAPAFRAFPEALESRRSQLYIPFDLSDACERLVNLIENGEPRCCRLAEYNHETLDRTINVIQQTKFYERPGYVPAT